MKESLYNIKHWHKYKCYQWVLNLIINQPIRKRTGHNNYSLKKCPCFGRHVKPLVPVLQPLVTTNPHWARVLGYVPFSLYVIHKEGLCPSSGDINRLMMIIMKKIEQAASLFYTVIKRGSYRIFATIVSSNWEIEVLINHSTKSHWYLYGIWYCYQVEVLSTAAEVTGQGVGTLLLRTALDHAQELRHPVVQVIASSKYT
jgi:RimJ/RimL family protein N-acetyltransferase